MEIDRFKLGVDTIANYPIVLKSFVLMNRAFQQTAKKYDTWRLFQIVFIVSLVPDIVACDENIMPPEDKAKTTLSEVSSRPAAVRRKLSLAFWCLIFSLTGFGARTAA